MLKACYACGQVHDKAVSCRAPWGGKTVQSLTRQVIERDHGICHLCGQPGADTADHVIPRSVGGSDALSNLKAAHRRCNLVKGAS